MSGARWCPRPDDFVLGSGEVHVWQVSLGDFRAATLAPIISADERARVARLRFEQDRRKFIVARGLLRIILGSYLRVEPGCLRFHYGHRGKPFLAEEFNKGEIKFNLSHAHELALYAITRDREIGVDIEHLRPDLADDSVAAQFFSPREVIALAADARKEAFFNCWTRKEAYLKARVEGLSFPLDQFDVSMAPGAPAALLRNDHDPRELSWWSLRQPPVHPGYVAALAVEGHDWRLKCWHVRGEGTKTFGENVDVF